MDRATCCWNKYIACSAHAVAVFVISIAYESDTVPVHRYAAASVLDATWTNPGVECTKRLFTNR